MNFVLCGMSGAGKSSVGAELARMTGRKFVDTDARIVAEYGEISTIFEQHGEAYFRELETKLSKTLAQEDDLVIATGGGLVMRTENAELLKHSGKIIYLRAGLGTLIRRLSGDTSRPLLQGNMEERLTELLAARASTYECIADLIFDTDGMSVHEIAEKICTEVQL